MKSSQEYFDGSVLVGVHTAHGIESRYVRARGLLASNDSPRVSTEKPEGTPCRDERQTTEDRTPDVDSSFISNA